MLTIAVALLALVVVFAAILFVTLDAIVSTLNGRRSLLEELSTGTRRRVLRGLDRLAFAIAPPHGARCA